MGAQSASAGAVTPHGANINGLRADPARIAAVRNDPDLQAGGDSTTYGETAAVRVMDCLQRLAQAAPGHDLEQSAAIIRRLRGRIERADPNMLRSRGGFGGLFDKGRERLTAFREAFADLSRDLRDADADLSGRRAGLERRWAKLDSLHADLAAAVAELDAWIAAGMIALKDRPRAETAAPEDRSLNALIEDLRDATQTSARPDDLLEGRLTRLVGLRSGAVARLARVRTCQNAEGAAPDLNQQACAALSAWREDWSAALGADSRKPRRLRPDPAQLEATRARVIGIIKRMEIALDAASARRTAAADRIGPPETV